MKATEWFYGAQGFGISTPRQIPIVPCCSNCGSSRNSVEFDAAYLGITDPICCDDERFQ